MSKQPAPETGTAAADEIPECPSCLKPVLLCICDSITPIENKVSLLILQHPQEQDRALGTARLTALHFANAVLKIGLSWPSLSKALGRPVHDPSRWAVLYLGSAKVADLETDRDIVAINLDTAAGWFIERAEQAEQRALAAAAAADNAGKLAFRHPKRHIIHGQYLDITAGKDSFDVFDF